MILQQCGIKSSLRIQEVFSVKGEEIRGILEVSIHNHKTFTQNEKELRVSADENFFVHVLISHQKFNIFIY